MAYNKVTHDFETRSELDLKKVGAYKYSLHPSTRPTCFAFKLPNNNKVHFLDFYMVNLHWSDLPMDIKAPWSYAIKSGLEFSAHNSFFEWCIYTNIMVKRNGWPGIPLRRRRCTAAKAAACALPRSLEGTGEALGLSIQKDKRGYAAMMVTCKPTRKFNDWNKMRDAINDRMKLGKSLTPKQKKWAESRPQMPEKFLTPKSAPDVFKTLYHYCKIDVLAEEQLDLALPDLSPAEQQIWFLNQVQNWRGLRLDIPTIQKITDIMENDGSKKLKELDNLTMGLVTKAGARKSILEFLALEGIELPDLKAKTVEDFLKGGKLSEDMHRLLEIRQALSKTSTKKYKTFLDRANEDGRVRDILLYHGASTGRESGTGINPNNFPKGLIQVEESRPYAAVNDVVQCSEEMLKLLYGDSLSILFSAILRNMIIPSEGCELFVADFSKIEVAILWWLADNKKGLEILRSGKDPYIYQAAANLGKTYEEILSAIKAGEKWAIDARQLGKAQILGSGYGMGPAKFQATAWDQYRLKLSMDQSRFAVKKYREANAAVPELWKAYEAAAIAAVAAKTKTFSAGRCKFYMEDRFLKMELPSGRRLSYLNPRITMRETDFGPRRTLEFWGLAKNKKQMQLERTWGGTLTENSCQSIARDLMMPALGRLEKAGYRALLSVYDEGLCERKIGEGSLEEFKKILCEVPPWGRGLPIEASGWIGPRYRK